MDEKRLGNFIAQRRKTLDMTQKDLASKLHVTDKAVSKWETGKGFPDLKMMEPLADALQVTLYELMEGRLLIPRSKIRSSSFRRRIRWSGRRWTIPVRGRKRRRDRSWESWCWQ